MRMQFSYGSVCSGIEAASVAWHTLGWRPAWFAEVEANPSAILAHRWPNVPNLGDMTLLARYVRAGYIEAPDVLVGGTPCQAFSVAGLRGGLTDARGQLTLTYVDLANAIDEKRGAGNECVIYWENVPGVLSDATNAFGCLLGALAGEDGPLVNARGKWSNSGLVVGPQRAIAWRVLDAQYFGVAQRRRRVFLVASARDGFDPAKLLFELDSLRRDSPPRRETWQDVAGTVTGGSRRRGGYSADDVPLTAGTLRSTDGGCDVDHVLAGHVQAVAGTLCVGGEGAGSATQQDAETGMLVPSLAFGGNNTAGPIDVATACNACASASGRMDFESETFIVQHAFAAADYKAGTFEACETARTLTTSTDRTRGAPICVTGPLYPVLSFKPGQSEAAGGIFITEDFAPTLQAQNNGSTAVPAVCVTGDITHTLKAEGFDASEDGTGRGQPIVAAYGFQPRIARNGRGDMGDVCAALTAQAGENGTGDAAPHVAITYAPAAPFVWWRVRRLTPRECERLQGFPDDYTLVPMDRRKPARDGDRRGEPRMMADGPRYKALGNSMAVPCMRWLGVRLMLTHPEYFY